MRAPLLALVLIAWAPTADANPAAEGRKLALRHECNRCHTLPDIPHASDQKSCVRCHQQILAGTFDAPADTLAQWQKNITSLIEAPSLVNMGGRFEPTWLAGFLQSPFDLRPRLDASMPRLALSPEEATAIAAYLTATPRQALPKAPEGGDPARGRRLLGEKGCTLCHLFTGAPASDPAPSLPFELPNKALLRGMTLAPDLRHSRDRLNPSALLAQIKSPSARATDSPMPTIAMSEQDALDTASWILKAPLDPPPNRAIPPRLPVLARRVGYEEVSARVFRKVCWHCHAEAEYALGDGGPGNTGGFGFKGRGISFTDDISVASGGRDRSGQRRSLFKPLPEGDMPWLVASLRARQLEEAGKTLPGILGMPLGLPALSDRDIQLVESWIAQGRPR